MSRSKLSRLELMDDVDPHWRQSMGRTWVHRTEVGPSFSQKCARDI